MYTDQYIFWTKHANFLDIQSYLCENKLKLAFIQIFFPILLGDNQFLPLSVSFKMTLKFILWQIKA